MQFMSSRFVYWASTGIFGLVFTVGGAANVLGFEEPAQGLRHLGFRRIWAVSRRGPVVRGRRGPRSGAAAAQGMGLRRSVLPAHGRGVCASALRRPAGGDCASALCVGRRRLLVLVAAAGAAARLAACRSCYSLSAIHCCLPSTIRIRRFGSIAGKVSVAPPGQRTSRASTLSSAPRPNVATISLCEQ